MTTCQIVNFVFSAARLIQNLQQNTYINKTNM